MIEPHYPIHYIKPIVLPDGTLIQFRPIHPMYGIQAVRFKETLSDESIKARFLGYIPQVSERNILRLAKIDYSKDMAIIAETDEDAAKKIIGIGRIAQDAEDPTHAELAIIISDAWHGRSLGARLTDYMIRIAGEMNYDALFALVFSNNKKMIDILKRRHFNFSPADKNILKGLLPLTVKK